jgi:hypothetical protein
LSAATWSITTCPNGTTSNKSSTGTCIGQW